MVDILNSWHIDDCAPYPEKGLNKLIFDVEFVEKADQDVDCVVIFVNDQLKFYGDDFNSNLKCEELLLNLNKFEFFKGELYQVRNMHLVLDGSKIRHLMFVGIGDESKLKPFHIRNLGGVIHKNASSAYVNSVIISVNSDFGSVLSNDISCLIASGAFLASYRFDKYLTQKRPCEKFLTKKMFLKVKDSAMVKNIFENSYKSIDLGVILCRELANEAPNELYPETYADEIEHHFEGFSDSVTVKILDEVALRELGMMALLGVGRGSSKESRVVIIEYDGLKVADANVVCLVGKGVTFDSGGISLKPSANMGDMKYDMSGSAAVVGVIKALAIKKAKVKVIGVIGLVENMPDGNAQRPGDIVRSASGKTIEIGNTDAEGRLVLADCLWYVQEHYKNISCIVDIATLTGAITIALGDIYAGLFTHNDELSNKFLEASRITDEKIWRLPLDEGFNKMLKSSVADMNNISQVSGGGASTAAEFLSNFVKVDNKNKWVHVDIAGTAWERNSENPICHSGSKGYGVRLITQVVIDNYEIIA